MYLYCNAFFEKIVKYLFLKQAYDNICQILYCGVLCPGGIGTSGKFKKKQKFEFKFDYILGYGALGGLNFLSHNSFS